MAAIEGLQCFSLEMEAAHQHRVFSIASHDALATRFHAAVVAVLLFQYLVMALLQADEIAVLNHAAQIGIECSGCEA